MSNPEPASEQVLATATEPAVLGPLTRWMRTILQVAVALVAAVPTMAALFNVSAEKSAQIAAGMGALVAIVSALQNAFNSQQAAAADRADRGEINLATLFLIVALVCFVVFALIAHGTFATDEGFTWLGAGLVSATLAKLVP